MNILVRNCLNKLSIVMKSKGSNLIDNVAFCSALSAVSFSRPYMLLVNKVNNDFLKDVTLFTQPASTKLSSTSPLKNIRYSEKIVLEIRESAFDKYDVEELLAVIMNSVTQIVLTTTTTSRCLELLNYIFENGTNKRVNDFNAYFFITALMNYLNINPYEAVIMEDSVLTAHSLMIEFELADTYNDTLNKNDKGTNTTMMIIDAQYKTDILQVKQIYKYLISEEANFRRFLDSLITTFPYIGLSMVINAKHKEYVASKLTIGQSNLLEEILYPLINPSETINEGVFGIGNDYTYKRYRFKVDSVLIMIQNMEYNDEKQYIRNQIFKLEKELSVHAEKRDNLIKAAKNDEVVKHYKVIYEGLTNLMQELSLIRDGLVKTKPVPKKIGLFIEYPAGWEG